MAFYFQQNKNYFLVGLTAGATRKLFHARLQRYGGAYCSLFCLSVSLCLHLSRYIPDLKIGRKIEEFSRISSACDSNTHSQHDEVQNGPGFSGIVLA